MEEYLFEAKEELKRLEHIIYVSLKYTRTVDVITNALHRMVGMFDLIAEAFMERALDEGKIEAIPKSPALRVKRLRGLYPEDAELQKYLAFYEFLKIILNSDYKKREEFRRHVTLIVNFENSTAEIDIDNLLNAEKFMHKFFAYAWRVIMGKDIDAEDD